MNSNSSGKKLEGILSGKGFYIVLFLCAAVIGVSAWMMAAGNGAMQEDVLPTSGSEKRVETVIIPVQPREQTEDEALAPTPPAISEDGLLETAGSEENAEEAASVPVTASAPVWQWPLNGEVARSHDGNRLSYDLTMQDWRSHDGIDILAQPGDIVRASSAGTVVSVRRDDMLGTLIVIDHGDGSRTTYANLQELPAVVEGQWVEAGQTIGAVGRSALAEIGQETHLHFAMQVDGRAVDPLAYLPA